MKISLKLLFLAFTAPTSFATAQPINWTKYSIPDTGTSVDLPISIFTKDAGEPDGHGHRLNTDDGRANLTIQAVPNAENDTPASYLAKKQPPRNIQYKRVTSSFFAVSSYKDDMVWYDRCNFSRRVIHCVLINYPAREERNWDDMVTRISLSLSGK